MSDEPEFLSLVEVAALLRVSTTTLYGMAKRGEMPFVKVGRAWRMSRAELRRRMTRPEANP